MPMSLPEIKSLPSQAGRHLPLESDGGQNAVAMEQTVIYRWRLKPGREKDFEEAWAEGTQEIRSRCQSGGAELHCGPDGVFYSLARWPSLVARRTCFEDPHWNDAAWMATMKECTLERLPELSLEGLRDLRKSDKEMRIPPVLTTDRLTLRPLTFDDAEGVAPALCDEKNMTYWSRGPLEGVEAVREYISWNVAGAGIECWAITESARDHDALGWVILMDRDKDILELGYILRPDAQGRGLAREAVTKAISHAFHTRGVRRLYADIDPDNASSVKAMKALGFSYEGLLRGTWKTHLGVRDSVIYARLSTDPDPA